ncbi:ATP-binding domain-containing protein [Synechococcus sp. RSCCF101]|uniref:ATP-binding domain-containing protein n=1 Tax=Synechococcus sp. RSCCF101 TaxID=2511069 RepID=UPI002106B6B4|nr:ATP-binding domain-containing protein [Synechococcus sp. RSCCF101]
MASDLFRAGDGPLRRQLLYVAVTRARERVWIEGVETAGARTWSARELALSSVADPPAPASPGSPPAPG